MQEKTPMDQQARQAISDFVEEMEEIYPELVDTSLEGATHSLIQDLREQGDQYGD